MNTKTIKKYEKMKLNNRIGLHALYLRTASMDTQYGYAGQMYKVNAFIAFYMN